jgi:glycerol kinase
MLIGLDRGTKPGHIARAALESIAFQVTDVISAMIKDIGKPISSMYVDGGASSNNLLMQFQADMLQTKVQRPAMLETTAAGAAYLAGLATGFWSSTDQIAELRSPGTIFEPKLESAKAHSQYLRWQNAVDRSKGWNIGEI